MKNRMRRGAWMVVFVAGLLVAALPWGQGAYGIWRQHALRAAWEQQAAQATREASHAGRPAGRSTPGAVARHPTPAAHGAAPHAPPAAARGGVTKSAGALHRGGNDTELAALAVLAAARSKSVTSWLDSLTYWPPTRLVIPDLHLDVVVVEGMDEAALQQGPGHDPASDLPGEPGNCVIAGHRNVWGSFFYHLNALGTGAKIRLLTFGKTYTYKVASTRIVPETDTTVLLPPPGPHAPPRLTLYTCTLPHSGDRVVVVANLASSQSG